MKISNFMQHSPVTIAEDRPIRDVVRLIFNLGVSAVLVSKDKKLVGVITETDILHHLFPSIREFMEDYVNLRDFDLMEQNMAGLLAQPVSSIMTKNVKTITPETPVLHAQSLLLLNKFSHLPVVKEDKKLVGIISQGDIFRALVSEEIPFETQAEYHNWMSRYFDMAIGQPLKRKVEYDQLSELFGKHQMKRIVDVGCGTGNHVIALVKKGFEMVGLESSKGMFKEAMKKFEQLSNLEKNRTVFVRGDNYVDMLNDRKQQFDAAIFMGNALAHMAASFQEVLSAAERHLAKNKAFMVIHLVNSDYVFKQGRIQSFMVKPSAVNPNGELAFVEFYDPSRKGSDTLTLTMGVMQFNGKRWSMIGINSTPLAHITPAAITKLLRSLRFNSIELFGSNYGESLFDRKFDPERDPWYTVVARR